MDLEDGELAERYYLDLASAFVRGRLPELAPLDDEAAIRAGLEQGLRLHKFKRNTELPRVKKVLGILRGLSPESLLDVGSGRGTFLWPMLDALPWVPVTAIDVDPRRAGDLQAVTRGGIDRLTGLRMDATRLELPDREVDVVTMLEVLEHLPKPELAAREAVRVARRFVVASVPSHEDDNPEHIHLFDQPRLETLFRSAGARRISFEQVLNHLILVAAV